MTMKTQRRLFIISTTLFFLCSLLIISITYSGLFYAFYQQDEWMTLGLFKAYGFIGTLKGIGLVQILTGVGRPLVIPIHYIFFHFFTFQVWPFAVFSILLHILNSLAIYLIMFLLSGSLGAAWIAGLFFAVSYNGSQAVSWFAASTTTLPSAFFLFLSILLFIIYIRNNKTLYLIWSQICVIISYFFKESSIILVVFLPVLYMAYIKGKSAIIRVTRSFLPLFTYFFFIVAITLIRLLTPVEQVGKFVGQVNGGIVRIIGNTIFYPILSFSQVFIPMPILHKVSDSLREVNMMSDIVFLILSAVLLVCITITLILGKPYRRELSIIVVFTLLSFVPFAVLERGASYLDSRYFYIGMAGGGMLLGMYTAICWDKLKLIRHRWLFRLVVIAGIGFFGLYAYKNIQFIQRDIQLQVLNAQERIALLNHMKQLYPVLPKNTVIYITGDHAGYYGIVNQKMPFQQGIGYTLMVWYFPEGNIIKDLLGPHGDFLWDIHSQGYMETNGNGFGYYWDKETMKVDMIGKKLFTKNQVIGLYYHNNTKKLEDITNVIRDEMP